MKINKGNKLKTIQLPSKNVLFYLYTLRIYGDTIKYIKSKTYI